jgi:MFS family permease
MKVIKVLLGCFCFSLVALYVIALIALSQLAAKTTYEWGMVGGAILGATLLGALGLAAFKSAMKRSDEESGTWRWFIAFVLVGAYAGFVLMGTLRKLGHNMHFSPSLVRGPQTVEDAQREAVRRFPQLGVAGSAFNREFLARAARYRTEKPAYFQDVQWPLHLAQECDATARR